MSTIRDPAYITDAGRTMMTAGGDVTYTKAVLYGQDISHLTSDQVKALTTIGSPLREVKVGISDKQNTDRGTTVILEATFQNDNLANDLPYTAVGFFAQKGNDEKLIAVAVANTGAYLTATSPDGVATDALDLKLAIAIGDATNVTATVDPAGSVTPATLNGAINKATHDLSAKIDTKADKTTVESELAIKVNSTDVDKELATKANSSDVYTKKQVDDAFANRDATIATKADKATVDAEIAKIDFTPYAKTADVNNEIKTVTDLANSKVDATYSYSKAELDKKLLALSTGTSGKVDANQVATMIEGKADKTDVDKQIKAVNDAVATKADKATVDAEIGKIDFTPYAKAADVDAKVKTVTDLANTKASQADLDHLNIVKADKSSTYTKTEVDSKVNDAKNSAQSSDNQIWGAVNNLRGFRTVDSPDFNNLTDYGIYYVSNPGNGKNYPADSWGVLIISNGNNARLVQTYYPDNGDAPFYRMRVDKTWQPWRQLAKASDVSNLQTQINNNDKATITVGYDWNKGSATNETRTLQNTWLVDQQVFSGAVTRMNDLQNQINSKHNVVTPLFRAISNSNTWNDIFGVNNPNDVLTSLRINAGGTGALLNNYAAGIGFGGADTKGVLSVSYGDHQARITGGNSDRPQWSEDIAWKSDVNNLQNQVNDLINQINYIKQNYLQGKRFPASQEAQAQAWENANPNGIAMIEK